VSTGKVLLLVFGVIVLLISFGLMFGGGSIVWADSTLKDSEGFYTTRAFPLETDAYAIVTPPTYIDLDPGWYWDWSNVATIFDPGWYWDWSNVATIKVKGTNADPAKQVFIGVARESDLKAYLSDVEYDEIREFSLDAHRVDCDYRNHPGDSRPAVPTAQTFWRASAHGSGTRTLEWGIETGSYMLVLMNSDGSAGVDLNTVVGAKIPPILFGVGVSLLVGGVVALAIGTLMILLAARRA